ncbi:hypothetical protein P186_0401 [Pyrobaculum ferrireducens]|uniref:Uncharacterized protein n=1 Tax=Pyrobaculum ferrireducens TaxID=1104324 RepID=G7VGE4_9CREN|nr:hypothetical protein P186_0401 [Pyrobaculum ferrireducens]
MFFYAYREINLSYIPKRGLVRRGGTPRWSSATTSIERR